MCGWIIQQIRSISALADYPTAFNNYSAKPGTITILHGIAFANPFLPERVEFEKEALGDKFDPETREFWSWSFNDQLDRPNNLLLERLVHELTTKLRAKISAADSVEEEDLQLYDDLALYVLYYSAIFNTAQNAKEICLTEFDWDKFHEAFEYWMNIDGKKSPSYGQAAHVFAYLHQLKRAFINIFHCVIGQSLPIAQLRARIFQSIFTHDLRRYRDSLYKSMQEVTTLVVGSTGTGKELVAKAIGTSQYIPFNVKNKQFQCNSAEQFVALNLTAFTPTLIESELFGHEKGSFTGATTRRIGWLESIGTCGALFLDEIGELDLAIQVKLLRVLQNREFQRIGENKTRRFEGKFIAATNRNLMDEIEANSFRQDFYYRLCSDVIVTPSLKEQIASRSEEFEFLVDFTARRLAPDAKDELKADVMKWFSSSAMSTYDWPGNMRELEQCVRSIMIHNSYRPATRTKGRDNCDFADQLNECQLSAEQVLSEYCKMAYRKYGSYEKAGAVLKMDRRTLRAKSSQTFDYD